MTRPHDAALERAARAIAGADALLLAIGGAHDLAGGLTQLATSPEAFGQACPVWAELGLGYQDLADVRWFARDPTLAWALYGAPVQRAATALPDALWSTLARWVQRHDHTFVFTSTTGGPATAAGIADDAVYEVHGSLRWLQCSLPCTDALWPAQTLLPEAPAVDSGTGRLAPGSDWPRCPSCERTARPNVILVNDWTFVDARVTAQHQRYRRWLADVHAGRLVVVELGTSPNEEHDAVRAQAASLEAAGATLVQLDDADAVATIDALVSRS